MRFLNFGSLNLDQVYQVDHIARPGETISSHAMYTLCGGKGLNQSIALSRAGADVFHAGSIGADGVILCDRLEAEGVGIEFVKKVDAPTGRAIIQIDSKGSNAILLFPGANHQIDPQQIEQALADFGSSDLLILQNELDCTKRLIDAAAAKGIPICLNPSPMDDAVVDLDLKKIGYLILNQIEGERLSGRKDPTAILDAILDIIPEGRIVLTLGKRGVLYGDRNGRLHHGIFQVPVVDTTAAGDTFTGFFLGSVARGAPIPDCLAIASAASSLSVTRLGAADSIPSWNEVMDFLSGNPRTEGRRP